MNRREAALLMALGVSRSIQPGRRPIRLAP